MYKQAEAHQNAGELEQAVTDYLRIASVAPQSPVREVAEFDAATTLMNMKDWDRAADVLLAYRRNYPASKNQFEVTTKLALVYQNSNKTLPAAKEFERVADQSKDPALQKEALNKAAEFYDKAKEYAAAIRIYQRLAHDFPKPVEPALEAYNQLVRLYRETGDEKSRTRALETIVSIDAKAGAERSDRTKYLAAKATFDLTEPVLRAFKDAVLGEPFKKTLANKKRLMQKALEAYGKVADYQIAEMTAATTYEIAGIYYEFSRDLLDSERPKNLNEEELVQYELLLEEQAYPFEEKAISVHEKNLELMTIGVYNQWIAKSLQQLAKLVPVRYARPELEENYFASIY